MTGSEQYNRTMAWLNHAPDEMTSYCEECGKPIPIQVSLCIACEDHLTDEAEAEGERWHEEREGWVSPRCVW